MQATDIYGPALVGLGLGLAMLNFFAPSTDSAHEAMASVIRLAIGVFAVVAGAYLTK